MFPDTEMVGNLQGVSCLLEVKVKKGLPLETTNTQKYLNRRLGLIEPLYMQHCSMQGYHYLTEYCCAIKYSIKETARLHRMR